MKTCPISPVIREREIKIRLRMTLCLLGWLKLKTTKWVLKRPWRVGDSLAIAGRAVKWWSHCGKHFVSLKKLKTAFRPDLTIPLQAVQPREVERDPSRNLHTNPLQSLVDVYKWVLSSKMNEPLTHCYSMDRSWRHYARENKSDMSRQILCEYTYMK